MAKIITEEKNQYLMKIGPYQEAINKIIKQENQLLDEIRKDSTHAGLKRLALVDVLSNLASYYIILSKVSQSLLNSRNLDALNDARKSISKAVAYLEEVVTSMVDAPYSEYEEKLAEISSVDAAHRYYLVRKIGLSIQLMKNAFGDNTKWRWSFVELEGRYAVGAKNIFNLKGAITNIDPRSPDYEPSIRHLQLIKKLLMQSADRYREKYELTTSLIDDFKTANNYLSALRRLHIVLGDREDSETVKKKLDAWTVKLAADAKKIKEAAQAAQKN